MNESRSFADVFPMGTGGSGPGSTKKDIYRLARRPDFHLGEATVRPSVRTVEGPGGSATAEPRVMQVLLALADADGAVVSREDFIRLCWNGQIVGDDSINRAIGEVRRIARETRAGFEVETIPRIGYRLSGIEPRFATADPSPEMEKERRSFTRRWVMAGALATVAGGVALWNSRPPPPDRLARLIEESRIAMRAGTAATDRQAIALLEQAVGLAPDDSNAWGLLALARARAGEHALDKPESPVAEVERAAQRALQLDGGNADAKAALAIAIPYYGDWLAAERRFDSVLAQHPRHLFTQDARAFLLGAVGRMRESAQERLAFSRDAAFDANLQYRQIYALWFLNRTAEADRAAARGMEMWPRHPGMWFGRLWLLADTGRYDRALAHIEDESRRPSLPPPMVASVRSALIAAGSRKPADVEAATEQVMAGVGQSVAAVVNAMMLLNLMGAVDKAFDLARAYYLEQGPIIAMMQWAPDQPIGPDQRRRKTNMLFTPTAAAMQRDPRFMPLMEEMGLGDYWRRRGVVPDFLASRRA